MNWLAHLLLSEPTPEFRIGNLLPDFVTPAEIAALAETYRRGATCHRRIDAFTDAHPVVRRSRARIGEAHRRYAGILVDVFYDHVLAREWSAHCGVAREVFLAEVRTGAETCDAALPPGMRRALGRMRSERWLEGYHELAGIERALARLSRRLRRPADLAAAVPRLGERYAEFAGDFAEFFPELRARVCAEFPAVPRE